jgi:DNA-binding transcriptional LysR family regulator
MIKNASLRQLKVFEAVARNLSYTRAAEELFTTQPTVSIQLKQLTELVGQPLIEQIGKKIYLTDIGQELLKVCHEIFETLSRFEMMVSDAKGVKAGKLRLSVITTAKYFVPRLLGLFCQRYPGIDVSLKVINREMVLQRIVANMDDLYVLGQPPEQIDMVAEPFLENPLVVLAAANHPLAGKKSIPLKSLASEPFVLRESGSGTRLATEKFFSEHGINMKVRMELGSNEAIKQAVIGGLGLSVLSAHTLALEHNNNELTILDVKGFPLHRQWYLAYHNGKSLSVVAKAFLDFIDTEKKLLGEKYLTRISGFPSKKPTAKRK